MRQTDDIIRERRKSMGLSVDKIADQLGVSRASYYRWESGELYNMPIDIVPPLAKILRLTPAQIMGWETVKNPPYSAPRVADEPEPLVLQLYNQLDADDQDEILNIIRYKLQKKKDSGKKEIRYA